MAAKKPFNPFYLLLVVVGTAFCITACAYGVMAMRSLKRPPHPAQAAATASGGDLLGFISRRGETLLIGELLLLGVATFGAIGTDDYWTRRAEAARKRNSAEQETAP